jgi:2-dehydro-3-deoxyphosphooctonate aldolase (KDO 8-P synthase)
LRALAARHVAIGAAGQMGNDLPLAVIAGPCQLQSLDHAQMIAGHMAQICAAHGAPYVFKASFDKANRSSIAGARGVGLDAGLQILAAVRAMGVAVMTDIHDPAQAALAAQVVDILQIPALLCRQTDLLLAAGRTGCAVNIKKGQFLAPWDMEHAAAKVAHTGNHRILLTERGTSFGYNNLVADMRALPIMAQTGYPVIMDATHAVQAPGALGSSSGGARALAPALARAAVAVGVAGVFLETHESPDTAPSDGPCMVPLAEMAALIGQLVALDRVVKTPRPRE